MSGQPKKLEDLFWDAKQLDSDEDRERFTNRIAASDGYLADELRCLLKQDAKSDQFFSGLSVRDASAGSYDKACDSVAEGKASSGSVASVRAGSKIGPYKLLEPIGEGGMGLVYRVRMPNSDCNHYRRGDFDRPSGQGKACGIGRVSPRVADAGDDGRRRGRAFLDHA